MLLGQDEISSAWLNTGFIAYKAHGFMYEKYNAFEIGVGGGGGEYTPQVGFGWTNGVALVLLSEQGDEDTSDKHTSPVLLAVGMVYIFLVLVAAVAMWIRMRTCSSGSTADNTDLLAEKHIYADDADLIAVKSPLSYDHCGAEGATINPIASAHSPPVDYNNYSRDRERNSSMNRDSMTNRDSVTNRDSAANRSNSSSRGSFGTSGSGGVKAAKRKNSKEATGISDEAQFLIEPVLDEATL
jgi:hypothetical protein